MPQNHLLGIEIGGTKLQLVSADQHGIIKDKLRFNIQPELGARGILDTITEGLKKFPLSDITATGVGFGGPVDWESGKVLVSHQISGWDNVELKAELEALLGMPVCIDNDANVAALGEAVYGCGKGHIRVFYMTIGSGIGGGFTINQQIYHGKAPGEVEVGHLRLDKNGTTLESKCSGWAIDRIIREYVSRSPDTILAALAKNVSSGEARLLKPAIEANDKYSMVLLDEVADDLGFSLSHVVHLMHPDVIILGGGLSLLGEELRSRIAARLPRYLMEAFLPAPPVLVSILGEDVVPIGALELARRSSRKNGQA